MRSSWERRHDARFDLPLEQLARVLRDARAYLGNDSGVSHLADAVGTPSLLLFGPTDPRLYAPRSATVRVIDAPAGPGQARHPFSKRYPSLAALAFDDVLAEVTRWLEDVRRVPAPATPPRRGPPAGDPSARCPTPREIASAPATLDAVDRLFRRAAAATVFGALARRGDATALAAWRRDAARAFGAIHVRAADAWKAIPTEFARRRERSHLRLAWRTGRSLRAFTRRMAVLVLPPRAVVAEADALPR